MTWRERISELRGKGEYPDVIDRRRSYSWETCAVGEQHNLHPEIVVYYTSHPSLMEVGPGPGPRDAILSDLGGEFHKYFSAGFWSVAETLLDKIEDRVLQLKREKNDGLV